MRHHYLRLIEREMKRLWINQYSIVVAELGKDKFHISDGKRGFQAKGHEIEKAIKRIPSRGGYVEFWKGMRELENKYKSRMRKREERKKK